MLFKNALRTLQKRYLQLLLLGIIIILSSFIYTVMDYSIEGILVPAEKFFTATNQEDFSIGMYDGLMPADQTYVENNCQSTLGAMNPSNWPLTVSGVKSIDETCYYGILDNRISTIKAAYPDVNMDLEVRESKNVYFTTNDNAYRVLFLKGMSVVDKTYLSAGTEPVNDNQIAISQTFAKDNNLKIGDNFNVKGTNYTITGFVLFPDYNLAVFGKQLIIDNSSQTFALVTDTQFNNIPETVSFEIGGVYHGIDAATFKTKVIDKLPTQTSLNFVSNITLTRNNLRSGGIYSDIRGGRAESIFMSLLIASMGLMIVGIMVSRVLHSQRGPIGILKSMGYTNNQIARPYLFLIMIMALPAILIGYFLGIYFAEPLKQLFLNFYLLPSQPIQQSLKTIIIAIALPFTFITTLSFVIIRRLLKQKPVTLLNPEINSNANFLTKEMGRFFKGLKITGKLQNLLLYRSVIKLFVYIVGMFFAAYLILLSFSMTGIYQRVLYDYYDQTNFNYIAYCDYGTACPVPANAEGVIEIPNTSVNNQDLTLFGIQPDSNMIPLYDTHNKLITSDLNQGAVISEAAHLSKGFNVGDTLNIQIGDKSMSVKVIGIAKFYSDKMVYVNISDLSQTLTGTSSYHNAVYSGDALNASNYDTVIKVTDIINQAGAMNGLMNDLVYMMIGVSIIIGAIIIYILTVMTVEDNFYNISLFKVLGYNQKEIDKMILGGYRIYGGVIFLITIPIAIYSFKLIQQWLAKMFDMQFPMQFFWWQGISALAIYIILFVIGARSAKHNLEKISLQEAMKMYEL